MKTVPVRVPRMSVIGSQEADLAIVCVYMFRWVSGVYSMSPSEQSLRTVISAPPTLQYGS